MKKAYTITFHWATNYGAILQAYALQQFMSECGYDTKIINYIPKALRKTFLRSFIAKSPERIYKQLKEYVKEQKIKKFRKKYLKCTKRYGSQSDLKRAEWDDAVYICGSDQIWNPYFTMNGENKVTTPYFIDFVNQGKKIAYAASFGVTELERKVIDVVEPLVKAFDLVSVREKTAIEILKGMNVDAKLVCDPVFLVKKEKYEKIFAEKIKKAPKVFRYILHEKQELPCQIAEYVRNKTNFEICSGVDTMSVEVWLSNLTSARIVVTNSFHAVAFSIIFHVPFVAVLIDGSGMNDRIITLLEETGLNDRTVMEFDSAKIDSLIDDDIDWVEVDENVEVMKNKAKAILQSI